MTVTPGNCCSSSGVAWLAHQLVGLERDKKALFDSIIVVTDRRILDKHILDKQIRDTIKSFAQVGNVVGHAQHSGDLRRFITAGKQIIITTVQKFPFILGEIGDEHRHPQEQNAGNFWRPLPTARR